MLFPSLLALATCILGATRAADTENNFITVPFTTVPVKRWPMGSKLGISDKDIVQSPILNVDIAYLMNLGIGEPPQKFTLLVDTGSSTTWVPAYGCDRECGYPMHSYMATNSSSFDPTGILMKIKYGEGFAYGFFARDTFTFAGQSAQGVYFAMSNANDGQLSEAGADGILGLGPDTLSRYDNPQHLVLPTLVSSMAEQSVISKNVFSFYFHPLSNDNAVWESRINGEIIFGGVDSSKVDGKIFYVPRSNQPHMLEYWAMDIDDVAINGKPMQMKEKLAAMIDSGSTLMYLPSSVLNLVFKPFPNARIMGNVYAVPCDTDNLPSITLYVNGFPMVLNPEDYLVSKGPFLITPTYSLCHTYLMNSPPGYSAILGYSFLQNYVTIFDNDKNRLGFGRRAS
ncbi:aspartic peptidase domain-containing protein [Gongronella butleri]|nr:aspartic peptidase domain-containing protein [Gongronella butleri]